MEEEAQLCYRIINTRTNQYVPAPRNTMGVYATERGARAGRTQIGKYLRRTRGESLENYQIVPYYLVKAEIIDRMDTHVCRIF